ncbi:hypothetical protein BVRB_008550 [Beta vulgaris subsp. vulgaris]|uniref:Uncharacterized protein n=1 Tax=Beta vulgaris subsp. vulgaris TaxID=3555 RepID=A0A0J8B6H5_BETVV|nr:hypothetical protein BVRB_008550 [Beta vulgaris subsp. vulgaris]
MQSFKDVLLEAENGPGALDGSGTPLGAPAGSGSAAGISLPSHGGKGKGLVLAHPVIELDSSDDEVGTEAISAIPPPLHAGKQLGSVELSAPVPVSFSATVTVVIVVLVLSARTISAKKWDEGVPFL